MEHNSWVLITGASRGIGKQIALAFAKEGHHLVLVSRSEAGMDALADEIRREHEVDVVTVACDVRQEDDVKRVFSLLDGKKIVIQTLVNNAGVMSDSMLMTMKKELLDLNFETNTYAAFYFSKYAIKHFIKARSGAIINLTSIIGVNGAPGQTAYSASKAAIIGFTKSLSKELAPLNIRVNAVAPGFIDTEMTSGLAEKDRTKALANIGMKRLGKAEDVAGIVLFLSSHKAAYITGQVIGVDGGMII